MPQVGWLWEGRKYAHQKMMDYSRTYPAGFKYTPEMLNGMFQHQERDYPSPTSIAGCPREQVFKMQTRYYVDIDKAWAAFRGTTAHEVLEKAAKVEPDALIERAVRRIVPMPDGATPHLRGRVDKIVPGLQLLVDYKSVEEHVNPDNQKGQRKMAGWRAQLSLYRWILGGPHDWFDDKAADLQKRKLGRYLTDEEAETFWIPQAPLEIERALIMQWHPKAPQPIELELWSMARAQRHAIARMTRHKGVHDGSYSVEKGILPAPLDFVTDGDLVWKCTAPGWCSFQKICFQLIGEGK